MFTVGQHVKVKQEVLDELAWADHPELGNVLVISAMPDIEPGRRPVVVVRGINGNTYQIHSHNLVLVEKISYIGLKMVLLKS